MAKKRKFEYNPKARFKVVKPGSEHQSKRDYKRHRKHKRKWEEGDERI
jgi:hypothetical protein